MDVWVDINECIDGCMDGYEWMDVYEWMDGWLE